MNADTSNPHKASDAPEVEAKTRDSGSKRPLSRHDTAVRYLKAFRKSERQKGFRHPDPEVLLERILVLEEVLGPAPSAIEKLKSHLKTFLEDPSVQSHLLTKKIGANIFGDKNPRPIFLTRDQRTRLATITDWGSSDPAVVFTRLFRASEHSLADEVNEIINEILASPADNQRVNKESEANKGGSSQLNKPFRRARDHEKPRWADENRSTVRFPMRMSSQLIAEIDGAARIAGQSRNEWMCNALQGFMAAGPGRVPEDFPDFKASKTVTFRLPPEVNEQVATLAKRSGLNKTEWARRIIRRQIERGDQPQPPYID